jgi:hypothetical protein
MLVDYILMVNPIRNSFGDSGWKFENNLKWVKYIMEIVYTNEIPPFKIQHTIDTIELNNGEEISILEYCKRTYGGKFLVKSQILGKYNRYTKEEFYFFYTEIPHPDGSNYYAFGFINGVPMITNGISIEDTTISAFLSFDGIIRYSASRHDYVSDSHGNFIDGGRDYTRCSVGNGEVRFGKISIRSGEVLFLETQQGN